MAKAPCVGELLGFVQDQVQAQVLKSPHYRNIDELLADVGADIKIEVKRWTPSEAVRKAYMALSQKEKEEYQTDSEDYDPWILHFETQKKLDDLLTNGGRDLIHLASFMTGSQPAALTQYAICNPGTFTPSATDTTLSGEITTPTGLARHVCSGSVDGITESFTHTAGGNTTVVVCGFKNNSGGSVTGIKGYGNFNAAGPPPAGTLGTESAFTSLDLGVNDILKLTVTLTLG